MADKQDIAMYGVLNRLIELGAKAAHESAKANSDDGHAGTEAWARFHALREEMRAELSRLQAGGQGAFLRERAQLEQEWCELRKLQAQYKQPAAPALVPLTPAEDLDAWKCERCNGDGWSWQMVQVAERESDQQEVRTHCEGLGWLGPDSERAAEPVTQQEHGDRMAFEKQASDSFNFKRSRRGTYVNPPIARDWKWFKAGAAHARARPLVPLSETAINILIASSEVYEYHPGAMLEFAKDLTREFCRINGLTVGGGERPECFEFAMDFLGDPEQSAIRQYIESLEARLSAPQAVGWRPIEEAPDDMTECVVVRWMDSDGQEHRDLDYREDGCWMRWHDHAEHVEIIGGHGVSYTPPYEHYMPVPPAPPTQQGDSNG